MNIWVFALLIFLFIDLLLVIWVLWRRKKRNKLSQKSLNFIHSHWIRIIDSFSHHPGQAVLDADKLLDYTLNQHGFKGSLGEKLKKAAARFSNLNNVWFAHKLRNRLAHEMGQPKIAEAKRALSYFKQALNDLGAGL